MKYPEPKFKVCPKCKKDKCEWYAYCLRTKTAICWYEPDDYDGKDIGSATVEEMRLQNDERIR